MKLDPKDLDTCVRCGLCLTACPTYRLTGMEGYSPRGRIAAARELGDDTARLSPVLADYLDTCLGCRACEAVCPSGVPYGRILEGARAVSPPRSGPVKRLIQAVLLWAVARRWRLSVLSLLAYPVQKLGLLRLGAAVARRGFGPRVLEGAAGLPAFRLRDLLSRLSTNYVPPEGVRERGQVVLFAGCVQDAWARDVHWATIGAFTRAGYRVRVPHDQWCCGALHAHAGRAEAAERLAGYNLGPLELFEGAIVVNAAGCGAKLKEYGEVLGERGEAVASRIGDVTEVLTPADVARVGAEPPAGLRRVAVHDACHLAHAQGVRTAPRELLEAAGYEVVDVPDDGRCCGAAGTYSLLHPEWARPLRADKIEACLATGADAVAVGNPGCAFWMASEPGAPAMYHPIQLVAMAMANAAAGE